MQKIDTKLYDKCKLELAAFMKKCVCCYLQLLSEIGSKGIWDKDVLPQYFHDTRRQMQAETNTLQAFLLDECVDIGPDKHIAFSEFRARYFSFCDEQSFTKRKSLTADERNAVFTPRGIVYVKPPENADPQNYHGYNVPYILGLTLIN